MTAAFLPPRQTGRADFPHPALAGRYCATRSQVNEPHPFELRANRGAFRGPPCPLATAAKMPRQAFPHEAVGLPEGVPAASRPVGVGPPFEVAVDLPDRFGKPLEAAFLVGQASAFPAAWPFSLCVTRPNRVRLRRGSQVRSTELRRQNCSRRCPLLYMLDIQLA